MSTVVFKFHTKTAGKGRIRLKPGEKPSQAPAGNIPRVTRLMALAIKFEQLVRDGRICDHAELARLGHVTRARMSQIMGLNNLAPDIQEEILFLPKTTKGRDPISSREVIKIATEVDWAEQRKAWLKLS